jgi:hypothetical protein
MAGTAEGEGQLTSLPTSGDCFKAPSTAAWLARADPDRSVIEASTAPKNGH